MIRSNEFVSRVNYDESRRVQCNVHVTQMMSALLIDLMDRNQGLNSTNQKKIIIIFTPSEIAKLAIFGISFPTTNKSSTQ